MQAPSVGFIGLGVMGTPMALNLVKAGTPLLVWNRTPAKLAAVEAAGATIAPDAATVFARSDVVILMLANDSAIDSVLKRGTVEFGGQVAGRTVVHMGTTKAEFSKALGADIEAAGGHYVEAPVSGSRIPAENGELVAMLAGEPDQVELVRQVIAPMCRETVSCGPVPNGLLMKLSVNICLITTVTGIAETIQFARRQGLDLDTVAHVLATGQMSSPIMKVKLPKLLTEDYSVQAAIADVWTNTRLITEAGRTAIIPTPLLDVCEALFRETNEWGYGESDMAAVVNAIAQRPVRIDCPILYDLAELEKREGELAPFFSVYDVGSIARTLVWSDRSEFLNRFIHFAGAAATGSTYAFWRVDDRTDLASLPVVVFNVEGGLFVAARNLYELLQLLANDTEIFDDQEDFYFAAKKDDTRSPGHDAFVRWLADEHGLKPATDPMGLVRRAQDEYGQQLWDFAQPFMDDPDGYFRTWCESAEPAYLSRRRS